MVLLIHFPKGVNFIHIDCVIDLPPPPLHSHQIFPSRVQTCPGAWGKHLSKVSHLALSSKGFWRKKNNRALLSLSGRK